MLVLGVWFGVGAVVTGGVGFAVPSQRTCEPPLGRVEELIDEIFFDADVPRQHVSQKAIREGGLGVGAAAPFRAVSTAAVAVVIRCVCPQG